MRMSKIVRFETGEEHCSSTESIAFFDFENHEVGVFPTNSHELETSLWRSRKRRAAGSSNQSEFEELLGSSSRPPGLMTCRKKKKL